tara:strand:+ start:2323 stop:2607 length:285 start_codon:yes stop_codon:yes gene_type:complete
VSVLWVAVAVDLTLAVVTEDCFGVELALAHGADPRRKRGVAKCTRFELTLPSPNSLNAATSEVALGVARNKRWCGTVTRLVSGDTRSIGGGGGQ